MRYTKPDSKNIFLATVIEEVESLRPWDWSLVRLISSVTLEGGRDLSPLWFPMCKQQVSRPLIKGRSESAENEIKKGDKSESQTKEKKTLPNQQSNSFLRVESCLLKMQPALKPFISFFPFLHREEFAIN